MPTFASCHCCASFSLIWPFIDAQMVLAAANAPVIARWTPDAKNGSMKPGTVLANKVY